MSIGPREGGGFGFAVKLTVEDRSLAQAELAALAKARRKICPYSHATRGNVDVQLEIVLAPNSLSDFAREPPFATACNVADHAPAHAISPACPRSIGEREIAEPSGKLSIGAVLDAAIFRAEDDELPRPAIGRGVVGLLAVIDRNLPVLPAVDDQQRASDRSGDVLQREAGA